jgi:hypothetical protein
MNFLILGTTYRPLLPSGIVLHLYGPLEKPPKIPALVPEKFPEFQKADLLHLYATIGLDSPQQIGAAPRRQPVSACGIPHESKHVAHAHSIIMTDYRLC